MRSVDQWSWFGKIVGKHSLNMRAQVMDQGPLIEVHVVGVLSCHGADGGDLPVRQR